MCMLVCVSCINITCGFVAYRLESYSTIFMPMYTYIYIGYLYGLTTFVS